MVFDIDAYFSRLGYGGETAVTAATLAALHEAQVGAIPFENIDVLLGRPLDLSAEGIAAKLVTRGRGGYCYEQNLLFMAALRALGFEVTALAARVRMGYVAPRPRTHAMLCVEAEGRKWLADCGFGIRGLLTPLPLSPGSEVTLPLVSFRVMAEAGLYLVQARGAGEAAWADLYVFSLEPQHEVDFVMANHFTSTWPRSPFIRSLIAARVTRERRFTLCDGAFTETTSAGTISRDLTTPEELFAVLARDFGLALSDPDIAARALAVKEPWG